MIYNQYDLNVVLSSFLDGPSLDTQFSLERLLREPSTKAETVAEFVQQHPEIKHLQSLRFEDLEEPADKHNKLIELCPNIYRITLFSCDSRRDFQSIVKWIRQCERIDSLWLPWSSTCWSNFMGLTQIKELNIHDWKCTDSREDYSNLIKSLPNLTALDCKPLRDLDCLTLINRPEQIKYLRLWYAQDACSRIALNWFSKIEYLDLTHNKPEALSDETLQSLKLPCIKALNLSSNDQLTDVGIISLKRFTHLTNLDLSFCKNIGDEALAVLLQHLQFSSLSLNGCSKITERGLSYLSSQKNLFSLNFGGSEKIHNISFMQSLSELRTLFIEYASLDETPDSLPMLTHLKKLSLLAIGHAPLINDIAVATLSGMTHLTNFQLYGTSITPQGAAIVKRLTIKDISWIG